MPKLPPGIRERDFNDALRKLTEAVGRDWVFRSDPDVALYRDAYSPLWGEADERLASAAVAPASVDEVQAIVRIANEYRLPLYAFSTGRNLTYGGASPAYSGSVVVDMKRMNRVLDVNERDKTCLVEPGVSYFDLYRHLRQNKIRLWIDTADPGWGSPVGNAMDRGCGSTGAGYRDHFDAHCGLEVVLPNGELLRTGMGGNPRSKNWQIFKYSVGPWIDGVFSQSNYGIVTKMGFWMMEEPEAALAVTVSVPARMDIVPFLDTLNSLRYAHVIPSLVQLMSPIINGSPDPELVRLVTAGANASDQDWARYAQSRNQPFWTATYCYYGAPKVIAAHWEHTKDRLSSIRGVQFRETASYQFPLTDEQAEAAANKAQLGIPSLNLFSARTGPGMPPSDGHLDFSPVIPPRGEELLAIGSVTGKIYAEMGMTPPFLGGWMFHPRGIIVFCMVPTYRNAADNKRSRDLYERLLAACADNGWNVYRAHLWAQAAVLRTYGFNNGVLHRFHETLKDAIDPNGIIAPGRYDIWPRHLRRNRA